MKPGLIMKKSTILLGVFLFLHPNQILAQEKDIPDSNAIVLLNQQIDNLVVQKNINLLKNLYADDFVFSHGSGRVEGKAGWFTSVAKGNFLSRQHDSVSVELHPGVAIVRGKLSVQKKSKENISRYHLYYFRVFALRNKNWQLISHFTTEEHDDN